MLAGSGLQESRVELDGVETAVLEAGDGPPLVLMHGGIECGGAYWAPVADALARRHRLVAPDLPGLGESAPFAQPGTDAFLGWMRAVVERCGSKPVLVAHSLVGTLAARFAVRHGDLLQRLIVYGTPGIGPFRMPMKLRLVAIPAAIHPSERNERRFQRFALLDRERTRERDPDWFDAFSAYSVERARVRHVGRTMRWLISDCTTRVPPEELQRIPVPVALVWGRHDRMVSLDVGRAAAGALGWPLEVIEDAAHVPHLEQPEAFSALVARLTEPP
jgi:2-hydroxymuconate-semialdehyde hydrolase